MKHLNAIFEGLGSAILLAYRAFVSLPNAPRIIKRVVEQASPFSAFPPDIRSAADSLTILLCIFPSHGGQGSGFMRSFGDQDCKD